MKTILTTVVGSQAHGTTGPNSDTDTRSIYVLPTSEIVGIGKYNKFIENKETDDNSWEIAQFLYLGLRANPSVLEVLITEPILTSSLGEELRELFPAFLCRRHVYNAFKGFAEGQRKKIVSPLTTSLRKPKSASHYLRVLFNGIELLNTGSFTVKISDTEIGPAVIAAKKDQMLFEEVLQLGDDLLIKLNKAYEVSSLQLEPNKDIINDYLLKVRKEYW